MRHRLPSLTALRAFEAAARRGSMSRAAEELSVSPGAISRHVGLLEAHFGCRLFLRRQRGLELTEKGRGFFAAVAAAFDGIDDAAAALMGMDEWEELRVSLYPTFTSEWLLPRLPAFRTRHPSIELSLDAALRRIDFDTDAIDIGVITGTRGAKSLHQDALFTPVYFPVCSPDLLDDGPALTHPRDLARHTLLHSPSQIRNWRAWLTAAGGPDSALDRGLGFENSSLAYRAAREGAGVALGQLFYLAEDLAAGRLLAPFDLSLRSANTLYLACLARRSTQPPIKAFREWFLTAAAETDARSRALQPHLVENAVDFAAD